jgi:hypothetical protein
MTGTETEEHSGPFRSRRYAVSSLLAGRTSMETARHCKVAIIAHWKSDDSMRGKAATTAKESDMAADYQVKFNVHPPYRVKERKGEVWIEAEGLALAVDSVEDGQN